MPVFKRGPGVSGYFTGEASAIPFRRKPKLTTPIPNVSIKTLSEDDVMKSKNPTTIHNVIPSTQQAFVSDERDKPDDSSSVSMRQGQ
jgi:hypothetical protein